MSRVRPYNQSLSLLSVGHLPLPYLVSLVRLRLALLVFLTTRLWMSCCAVSRAPPLGLSLLGASAVGSIGLSSVSVSSRAFPSVPAMLSGVSASLSGGRYRSCATSIKASGGGGEENKN